MSEVPLYRVTVHDVEANPVRLSLSALKSETAPFPRAVGIVLLYRLASLIRKRTLLRTLQ